MLTIRAAQLPPLRVPLRASFARHAVKRLRELFPEESAPYNTKTLLGVALEGIARAEGVYGLTAERDVMRFLALQWCFGARFDSDPTLDWVAEANALDAPPPARFEALFRAGRRHAESGRGLRLHPEPDPPPAPEDPILGPAEYAEDFDAPPTDDPDIDDPDIDDSDEEPT